MVQNQSLSFMYGTNLETKLSNYLFLSYYSNDNELIQLF